MNLLPRLLMRRSSPRRPFATCLPGKLPCNWVNKREQLSSLLLIYELPMVKN
nr:MAG TPA: hypothetical protein [Caudoviricetes sp.]